jgi:hypothetical protein
MAIPPANGLERLAELGTARRDQPSLERGDHTDVEEVVLGGYERLRVSCVGFIVIYHDK